MNRITINSLVLILILFLASCACKAPETKLPEGVGLSFANMDTTATAANDFYEYANGGWMKKSEIPGDRGRWGSFDELREATQSDVLEALNEATKSTEYPEGS